MILPCWSWGAPQGLVGFVPGWLLGVDRFSGVSLWIIGDGGVVRHGRVRARGCGREACGP